MTLRLKIAFVYVLFTMTAAPQAHSQSPHAHRLGQSELTQQGRLATVRLVPGERKFEVFVIGQRAAKVDFSNAKITATAYSLKGKYPLRVTRQNDRFVLQGEGVEAHDPTRLELEADIGGQSEVFDFQLK